MTTIMSSSNNPPTTATATATATAATSNHVFVFPYPAQGHLLPLLDLTHQLALNGLKITILVTPKNLPTLNSLLTTHPNSIKPLVLPLPTHPKLPLGVENVKDIGNAGNVPIILALSKLEEQVMKWFQSHSSRPQAILSDFFLGFTNQWARQLNIPRFAFFSSGALLSCIMYHSLQNIDTLWNLKIIKFPNLPKSPSFAHQHLPTIFKTYKKGDSEWMFCKESMLENFNSWGLVFNTYYALEKEYLDHIKKELRHNRVYSIGPIKSTQINREMGMGYDVLNWLDKCPHESVLYVCFGSQKKLTKPQMEALAFGLEKSKTRFIWVVKSEASDMIPEGFETRVVDSGLVLKGWAPQTEILNHKAVGGFVSHCGWNSSLESMMAGVMILAWPMEADQFVNASLLVEDVGSAIQVCEDGYTVPDPDVLGRVIGESLGGNIPQKTRAKMIREKAFEAIKADGSSTRDLEALVKELGHKSHNYVKNWIIAN